MSAKLDPTSPNTSRLGIAIFGLSAPKHWSLAARLTAWYAVSSFALVFCATSLLYIALVHSLDTDADRLLSDRVQDVRIILSEHQPGSDHSDLRGELEEESSPRQHTPIYFRVIDP